MKAEQLKWNVGNGLVGKVLMPLDFYDAWNAAQKVPENERRYQELADFALVNGKQAREALSNIFPSYAKKIVGFSAGKAKAAYFDIRSVYFG